MQLVKIRSIPSLIQRLTDLATPRDHSDYIFRGQSDANWRLQSTYTRYTNALVDMRELVFKQLLYSFENNLAALDDDRMKNMDRRGKVEFARHCGVPSPLIDFTRSPLVALWFAFNGIRGSVQKGQNCAIYSLNLQNLALVMGQLLASDQWQREYFRNKFGKDFHGLFRWEKADFFEKGFPTNIIKFIPFAASWNRKMQRQMGCFLYDNLDYGHFNSNDLEDLIEQHPKTKEVNKNYPVFVKYVIPCNLARQAFDLLDLCGVNGTMLFDDYTGAVADVYNGFNYNTRRMSWDIPDPFQD